MSTESESAFAGKRKIGRVACTLGSGTYEFTAPAHREIKTPRGPSCT